MTFTEIVTDVMDRLGLSSSEAEARIGRAVNRHNRRISASLGLVTTRQTQTDADTTIGDAEVTFTGVEKLIGVWTLVGGSRKVLAEVTTTQLRDGRAPTSGKPSRYAIRRTTANTVTIELDCLPDSVFEIYADAYASLATIADDMEPAFAESYHDCLSEAVIADEYRKMEKLREAAAADAKAEKLLSELRYFLATSSYLKIRQGDSPRSSSRTTASGGGGGGSSASASTLMFTQSGTGAVERTVLNKLRERFSVKDFGAVGDGATDDAAAINAAIAASSAGSTVYFPAGNYAFGSPLIFKGGRSYVGDGWGSTAGTRFFQLAGSDLDAGFLSEAYDDNFEGPGAPVVFRDMFIDMNRDNNAGNGHGLHIFNWGSTFERVQVREAAGDGFHVEGGAAFQSGAETCVELVFRGCRVFGVDGSGLRVVDAAGNKITDGIVDGLCIFAETGSCGVAIDSSSGWAITGGAHFYGIGHSAIRLTRAHQSDVSGCYIETYGQTVDGGTYYAIELTSLVTGEPCTVVGNRINHKDSQGGNTYFGIFARSANENLNARVVISGNVLRLNGGEVGITLQVGTGSASLVAIVKGNDFYSVGDTKISTVSGVTLLAEGNSFQLAAAAPAAGVWWVGARVYYLAPAAGGFIGTVCTTAGTPGTWKDFGAIES